MQSQHNATAQDGDLNNRDPSRRGCQSCRDVAFRSAEGSERSCFFPPAPGRATEPRNRRREVVFAEDCIGDEAKRVVSALQQGQVALLENLRFHKEEEANSPDLARALAELGDIYVDDAFSAARAHASIDALARLHISASKAVRGNGQTATGACGASNSRGAVRTVARRDGRRCGQHVSEPRLRIDTVALAPPIDLHQRHQRGRSIM